MCEDDETEETKFQTTHNHMAGAIRHAEKRRTGTCAFADRVANVSLDCYRCNIPQVYRDTQRQTCIATIVAYFSNKDVLQVLSLGVGTKFLKHNLLIENGGTLDRVRDCHAEVLARRSFRLYLIKELKELQTSNSYNEDDSDNYILQESKLPSGSCRGKRKFELKQSVTLHMYTSSAPCGNATIKKFAQMKREIYDCSLPPNDWPKFTHDPVPPHSLHLGQFMLLVKRDPTSIDTEKLQDGPSKRRKPWPATESDNWCPAGTSIPHCNKGTIHTCSDKICRWNCLGLQGSLLSSFIHEPLYMASLTVARKFTECICRRAVCCRALGAHTSKVQTDAVKAVAIAKYKLNHPAIMGTGVYMDENGCLSMEGSREVGQDVRFHSTLAWCWCKSMNVAECINGTTGFVHDFEKHSMKEELCNESEKKIFSKISSNSFMNHHLELDQNRLTKYLKNGTTSEQNRITLPMLRAYKLEVSPNYESAKEDLLTHHRVLRGWARRETLFLEPALEVG